MPCGEGLAVVPSEVEKVQKGRASNHETLFNNSRQQQTAAWKAQLAPSRRETQRGLRRETAQAAKPSSIARGSGQ